MVRKTATPAPSEQSKLLRPRAELANALNIQWSKGEAIAAMQISSFDDLTAMRTAYYSWDEFNITLIERSFSGASEVQQYRGSAITAGMGVPGFQPNLGEDHRDAVGRVRTKIRRLMSLRDARG
jgi:hypothetical protein